MIRAYLDRWACEEGYRFTKQGFDLRVQARRFTTLQNLVALASLAWALLAAYQTERRSWCGTRNVRSDTTSYSRSIAAARLATAVCSRPKCFLPL